MNTMFLLVTPYQKKDDGSILWNASGPRLEDDCIPEDSRDIMSWSFGLFIFSDFKVRGSEENNMGAITFYEADNMSAPIRFSGSVRIKEGDFFSTHLKFSAVDSNLSDEADLGINGREGIPVLPLAQTCFNGYLKYAYPFHHSDYNHSQYLSECEYFYGVCTSKTLSTGSGLLMVFKGLQALYKDVIDNNYQKGARES